MRVSSVARMRLSSMTSTFAADGTGMFTSYDRRRNGQVALEAFPARRLLSRVNESRVRLGIAAGLVAAAGTTGALLGFGLRQGMPARPFNVAAAVLLGDAAAGSWGFHRVVTPVGVVMHVAGVLALGVLAALFTRRRITMRPSVVPSVIVSGGAGIVHMALLATGLVGARSLTVPQLVVVYVLLTAGLVVGMRLARTTDRFE